MNDEITNTTPEQFYEDHRVAANELKTWQGIVKNADSKAVSLRAQGQNSFDPEINRRATTLVQNQKANFESRDKAQKAYDKNLVESAAHYAMNADAYHEQAIEEAHARGIPINFHGGVAENVHKVE